MQPFELQNLFKTEKKFLQIRLKINCTIRLRRRKISTPRMVTNVMTIIIANIRVKITTERDAIENETETVERSEGGA